MIASATRSKKRLKQEFAAELILNGKTYDAAIENLSETGIKVRTSTTDTSVHFMPDTVVELQFESLSGAILSLNCRVVWSRKKSVKSLFTDVGLEIIEKSELYDDFLHSLCMHSIMLLMEYCE